MRDPARQEQAGVGDVAWVEPARSKEVACVIERHHDHDEAAQQVDRIDAGARHRTRAACRYRHQRATVAFKRQAHARRLRSAVMAVPGGAADLATREADVLEHAIIEALQIGLGTPPATTFGDRVQARPESPKHSRPNAGAGGICRSGAAPVRLRGRR